VGRRDASAWRPVKPWFAVVVTIVLLGALIVGDEARRVSLYAVHVSLDSPVLDRDARTLAVWVDGGGYCVGFGQTDPRSRFDHVEVHVDEETVHLTAWIREQPGVDDDTACAGVGTSPFIKRVELPVAVGDRALISRTYPRVPRRVLALPRGEAMVDWFSAPGFSYEGRDCQAARRYFAGAPRDSCVRLR
jgi:hypothetical protein